LQIPLILYFLRQVTIPALQDLFFFNKKFLSLCCLSFG
jgi:hypothetical protein